MENIAVYEAINAVQDDLAKVGISKDKKNIQQGYNFRGIDDVYGALSPLLAKHKLCIIPYVLSRSVSERTSKSGGVLFYVTVDCEFHFVSAIDGSKHIARTFGEAMDSGDKATNKAQSSAYKYAAFQTFCIPVDVPDADAETHEVISKQEKRPKDDVPDFQPTQTQAPEEKVAPSPILTSQPANADVISVAQGKRLFAISNSSGIETEQLKLFLMHFYGYEHSNQVAKNKYEEICGLVSSKEKFSEIMKTVSSRAA